VNGQNINLITDWTLIIIKKLNHIQHFHCSFIADMSLNHMVKVEEYKEAGENLQMFSKHVQPFARPNESSKQKRKKLSTKKEPQPKVSKGGEQSSITKWLQQTSRFQVKPIHPSKNINKKSKKVTFQLEVSARTIFKNGKLCKKEKKSLIGIQLLNGNWLYACDRRNTECAQQIIQSRKRLKAIYQAKKETMKEHKKDHIERTFQKHDIYPWNTFFRRPSKTCNHTGILKPIHECTTCIESHQQSFDN